MRQLGEYREFAISDIAHHINNINNSTDEDVISDETSEICVYIASCQEVSTELARRVLSLIQTEKIPEYTNYREYFLCYLIDVLEDIIVENSL